MYIHLVMPFYRANMKDTVLEWTGGLGVILHPIQFPKETEEALFTPSPRVQPFVCDAVPPWPEANPVNHKINRFIESTAIEDEDYYWIMGDDDLVDKEVVDKVRGMDNAVVFISMNRGKYLPMSPNIINRHPVGVLCAKPENVRLCGIGFEQMIIKGKVFKSLKFNEYSPTADGEMAMYLKGTMGEEIRYEPELQVKFNYFEPGRWKVGDVKEGGVKVVIATPFYSMQGWSNYISSLATSLLFLTRNTKVIVDFWAISGDSYIERARNTIANKFLRTDYTHLLFIDSDMGWDVVGLLRLIAANVPLVGAGFPCKNNWEFYGCKLHCNPDGTPIVNSKGLISSWNVPTGFCLIKKEVFLKLIEAHPDHKYGYQAPDDPTPMEYYDFFGHYFRSSDRDLRDDVYFCRKWAETGGEIWVEPRVNIGHAGFSEHKGNYHEFLMSCPGGSEDPKRKTDG